MLDKTEARKDLPESKDPETLVTVTDMKNARPERTAGRDSHAKTLDLSDPIYPRSAEAQHLSHSLDKAVKDGRLSEQSKERFEHCMRQLEHRAQERHMPTSELQNAYKQAARLLDAKDGAVPPKERAVLALQMMNHAAYPTCIDQGGHMTCNVTSVEELTFTKCPSKAMEVIATTALHGQWRAPDGKLIRIDSGSLQPGLEEAKSVAHGTPIDHKRSYASQIFQVVAVNDGLQRRNPPEFYHNLPNATGTTEEVVDAHGRTRRNVPGMPNDEIQDVCTNITGDTRNLIHRRNPDDPIDPHLVQVKDVNDLRFHLSRLDNQHDFPIIAFMNSDARAIRGSGNPSAASHVVCIIGYDQETHKVRISNFWGKNKEIWSDDALVFEGLLR